MSEYKELIAKEKKDEHEITITVAYLMGVASGGITGFLLGVVIAWGVHFLFL